MPALGNTMNDSYSSFWLENSSYLRLKNLEFGYTFRQPGLAKMGVSSVRVYFAGSNLLTFTSLKNWDPEKHRVMLEMTYIPICALIHLG